MNAYASPTAGTTAAPVEIDPADAVPSFVVRAGGFMLGASGFFMGGAGLQPIVFFDLSLPYMAVAGLLMALGLAAIAVAPWLVKGRSWAAVAGTGLAAVMALVAAVWMIFSLVQTLFSPLMILEFLVAGSRCWSCRSPSCPRSASARRARRCTADRSSVPGDADVAGAGLDVEHLICGRVAVQALDAHVA